MRNLQSLHLPGYQLAAWDAKPEEVREKFALANVRGTELRTVTETGWQRPRMASAGTGNTEGDRLTEWARESRIPVRPPIGVIDVAEESGRTDFLFFKEQLYAVVHQIDHNWAYKDDGDARAGSKRLNSGAQLLAAMRRKYGDPRLETLIKSDRPRERQQVDAALEPRPSSSRMAWLTWENNTGFVRAALKDVPQHVISVDTDEWPLRVGPIEWRVRIGALGFAGEVLTPTLPVTMQLGRADVLPYNPEVLVRRDGTIQAKLGIDGSFTAEPGKRWLVIVFDCTPYGTQPSSLEELRATVARGFTVILPTGAESKVQDLHVKGAVIFAVPGGFELIRAFAVGKEENDLALRIPTYSGQIPRVIPVDLSSTWFNYAGIAAPEMVELANAVPERIIYGSKSIRKVIEEDVVRAERDRKKQLEEQDKAKKQELDKF